MLKSVTLKEIKAETVKLLLTALFSSLGLLTNQSDAGVRYPIITACKNYKLHISCTKIS